MFFKRTASSPYAGFEAVAILVAAVMIGEHLAGASTVTYTIRFDAAWSAATHPQDFPPSPHFSSLVGGTHDDVVRLWDVGQLATNGIERMAELGATSSLSSEVQAAINTGNAFSIIRGGGIPVSPGLVQTEIDVDTAFSRVSLVSMIAPSPDWFVGVSGLDLRPNGRWVSEIIVDLVPYDAGTDSGATFTSGNQDTQPPDPISEITTFPFDGALPLGTFTFRRVSGLLGDANGDSKADGSDFNIWNQHRNSSGTHIGTGDFNNDGRTDDLDLVVLRDHLFTSREVESAVPEPSSYGLALLAAALLLLGCCRSRTGPPCLNPV